MYNKRYTIEGVQKVFKEKGLKNILGEEIQKDFFEEVIPDVKLDLQSREFITSLIDELKEMKQDLEQTLNKIEKAS